MMSTIFNLGTPSNQKQISFDEVIREIQTHVYESGAFPLGAIDFISEESGQAAGQKARIETQLQKAEGGRAFGMRFEANGISDGIFHKASMVIRQDIPEGVRVSLIYRTGYDHSKTRNQKATVRPVSLLKQLIQRFGASSNNIPIPIRPIKWNSAKAANLADFIMSHRRVLPIVYLSEYTGKFNATYIAKSLPGLAHVIIETDSRFAQNLRENIHLDLLCVNGNAKIYLPRASPEYIHHYSHPCPDSDNHHADNEIIKSVIRESSTLSVPEDMTYSSLLKAETINEARDSRDYRTLAELLSEENTELKKERFDLLSRIKSLEQRENGTPNIECPTEFSTLREAVDAIESQYSGNIIIPRSVRKNENRSYKYPIDAYKALEWLATKYLDNIKNKLGRGMQEMNRECQEASGFELSLHQCESTVRSRNYKAAYTVVHNGRKIMCEKHLKKGISRDPANLLRIGFEYLPDAGKVIIAYIVAHPDSPTCR